MDKSDIQNWQGNLKKKLGNEHKVFKLLCELQGRQMQDVLAELVDDYLKKHPKTVRLIKKSRSNKT